MSSGHSRLEMVLLTLFALLCRCFTGPFSSIGAASKQRNGDFDNRSRCFGSWRYLSRPSTASRDKQQPVIPKLRRYHHNHPTKEMFPFTPTFVVVVCLTLSVLASPYPNPQGFGICYTTAPNGQTVTVNKPGATVTQLNKATLTTTVTVNAFGTPPAKRVVVSC